MSRIRTVKPEFFRHLDLFEAESRSGLPLRLAFAGMLTVADRDGRFRWQPRVLKLDVLPFDDVDFGDVLDCLHVSGFIVKYEVDGEAFGFIPTFKKHQHVNMREPASNLPAPDDARACTCTHVTAHGEREGERELEREGDSPPLRFGETRARDQAPTDPVKAEFDTNFWPEYPHKVGKPKALLAFRAARRKHDLSAIMGGLSRYRSDKPPDRQWLNPATFLNQERFNDQPASVQPSNGNGHEHHRPNSISASVARVAARLHENGANRERDTPFAGGDAANAGAASGARAGEILASGAADHWSR